MASHDQGDRAQRTRTEAPGERERVPTKVAFVITCASCGREDTLPLVPKRLDGYVCRACAAKQYGADSRGAAGLTDGFVFNCTRCGTQSRLARAPQQTEGLLCRPCMDGTEVPHPERVAGNRVIDAKGGVRRKRRAEAESS